MGFTVNDYGKDGPTKDAKDLLDKDIAKWATENNIEKYTVGKKTVKCELFLDVILFDEHTCTASASVCWGANLGTPPAKTAKEGAATKKATTKAADSEAKPPVETGAITPETPVKDDAPAAAEKTQEKAATKPVEAAVTPPAATPPASDNSDAAERAAAAAERAAAAAERAAAAAEKAAAGNSNHAPATADATPDASRQISPAAKP